MTDPVNLRQFRKRKQRAEREREAEQNRLFHGRTRAERMLTTARNEMERRRHDAQRIEKGPTAQDAPAAGDPEPGTAKGGSEA